MTRSPVAPQERLLGFDARKMWLDAEAHWSAEHRIRFLLRNDSRPILSIDEFVWPSVFTTDQWPVATETQLEEHGLTGPARPSWIGLNVPLWESLTALREQLDVHAASIHRPYWTVAVTVFPAGQVEKPAGHGPASGGSDPAKVAESWRLLGYDVADGSLVSGLSNCGFTPEEQRLAAQRWSAHLNRHHLLDSASAADQFRQYTDSRVPEHAPFWVYGLFLIEEVR